MRCVAEVGDLVAHARREHEAAPVLQFALELAFQDIKHMAAIAPMIGEISGRIFDVPDPDVADIEGAPIGDALLAGMGGGLDLRPVGDGEGESGDFHGWLSGIAVSNKILTP